MAERYPAPQHRSLVTPIVRCSVAQWEVGKSQYVGLVARVTRAGACRRYGGSVGSPGLSCRPARRFRAGRPNPMTGGRADAFPANPLLTLMQRDATSCRRHMRENGVRGRPAALGPRFAPACGGSYKEWGRFSWCLMMPMVLVWLKTLVKSLIIVNDFSTGRKPLPLLGLRNWLVGNSQRRKLMICKDIYFGGG